ncbi:MAG: undecaprenyldiphospho-muramoylpentapeptide beta-N-acetylglucosaminyltransferase [Clostridia bacterium]|nr:undecaprenyldiphospho-muramoylpentapeptide beta-N-acetylglucosaminyltransferase [Clostridia bacterium]
MHILFAGGGTAGHINPALAVAQYIAKKHPNAKISYIGKKGGMEERLVAAAGFDFYGIDVAGFQRKISLKNIARNISAAEKAITSSVRAKRLLKQLNPDVVVGTGGYVSGPVLRQAAKLGLRTAIHEQNAFPGVTTKMLVPLVDTVMLAMVEAKPRLKLKKAPVITGNPVREDFLTLSKQTAKKDLNLPDLPVLLSAGGSLGAAPINNAVLDLITAKWKDNDILFLHATGKGGYEKFITELKARGVDLNAPNLIIKDYIDNMGQCMAAADLVIARAGAITLSELSVCGKPSILIPSPYVAENHQFHNAMSLKRAGAAEVIEEKDLNSTKLLDTVENIIHNNSKLTKMGSSAKENAIPDSCKRIYDEVMRLYTTK